MYCSHCGWELDECNESQPVCPCCGESDFTAINDNSADFLHDLVLEIEKGASAYKSVCWDCHKPVASDNPSTSKCNSCGWYRCAKCGSCKRGCPAK